jgi:hypothetical protein
MNAVFSQSVPAGGNVRWNSDAELTRYLNRSVRLRTYNPGSRRLANLRKQFAIGSNKDFSGSLRTVGEELLIRRPVVLRPLAIVAKIQTGRRTKGGPKPERRADHLGVVTKCASSGGPRSFTNLISLGMSLAATRQAFPISIFETTGALKPQTLPVSRSRVAMVLVAPLPMLLVPCPRFEPAHLSDSGQVCDHLSIHHPESPGPTVKDDAVVIGTSSRRSSPDHCVLGVTEQAWFSVGMGNRWGTRSKQTAFSNIYSIAKSAVDQGFREVGGTGIEPVTPAL